MILEEVESILCVGALYFADFFCESVAIVTVAHAALKASAPSATHLDVARFTLLGASFTLLWASPLLCLVTLIALDALFLEHKVPSLPRETYEHLHELLGAAIVSATWRSSLLGESYFKAFHDKVLREGEIHGAPVEFADIPLDALVVRNSSGSNRWLLVAGGSAEIYQRRLLSPGSDTWKKEKSHHWQLADQLGANILFFNYPGVGLSKGTVSRHAMIETHKMVQKYLEREEGAEQIVCLGFSLSGGLQAEAISEYSGKEGVEYVLIKDRTFSELRLAAEDRAGCLHHGRYHCLDGMSTPLKSALSRKLFSKEAVGEFLNQMG